jgi:hypothetical protein
MARALAWCQSASVPMGQCSIMPHRSLCIAARVLLPSLFVGPYGHRHCPGWYERRQWRHTVERSPTPYVEQPSWRSTQSSARRWPYCSNTAESPIAPSSASVPWTTRFLTYLRSPSSALREVRMFTARRVVGKCGVTELDDVYRRRVIHARFIAPALRAMLWPPGGRRCHSPR